MPLHSFNHDILYIKMFRKMWRIKKYSLFSPLVFINYSCKHIPKKFCILLATEHWVRALLDFSFFSKLPAKRPLYSFIHGILYIKMFIWIWEIKQHSLIFFSVCLYIILTFWIILVRMLIFLLLLITVFVFFFFFSDTNFHAKRSIDSVNPHMLMKAWKVMK